MFDNQYTVLDLSDDIIVVVKPDKTVFIIPDLSGVYTVATIADMLLLKCDLKSVVKVTANKHSYILKTKPVSTEANWIDLTSELDSKLDELYIFAHAFNTTIDQKVDKTQTIAGFNLQDNIAKQELLVALNVEEGAEVNVNPNWTAISGDGQIWNKPTTISGYGITNAYTKETIDNLLNTKLDLKLDIKPNATDLLISSVTGKIDPVYNTAGIKILKGQWNANSNNPTLPLTPTAEMTGWVYDVLTGGTRFGLVFNTGDQIVGYFNYWGKIDNTDLVTSVQSKTGAVTINGSEIPVSPTNTNKINAELGLKATITDMATALDLKLAKVDEFFVWEFPAVLFNVFTYNCSLRKNYQLSNTADITLMITNPVNGFEGMIITYGCALILPANVVLSADYGYITRVGNMHYVYEFTYDGINYHFSRIAEGTE